MVTLKALESGNWMVARSGQTRDDYLAALKDCMKENIMVADLENKTVELSDYTKAVNLAACLV